MKPRPRPLWAGILERPPARGPVCHPAPVSSSQPLGAGGGNHIHVRYRRRWAADVTQLSSSRSRPRPRCSEMKGKRRGHRDLKLEEPPGREPRPVGGGVGAPAARGPRRRRRMSWDWNYGRRRGWSKYHPIPSKGAWGKCCLDPCPRLLLWAPLLAEAVTAHPSPPPDPPTGPIAAPAFGP